MKLKQLTAGIGIEKLLVCIGLCLRCDALQTDFVFFIKTIWKFMENMLLI